MLAFGIALETRGTKSIGTHASSRQGGIPGGTPMLHQGSKLDTTRRQALFRGRDSATAKGDPRPTESTTNP
jgi:hypothetical protein